MKGLVKNNYKTNPAWIKSCENFRSGENTYKQPKYFHDDEDMSVAAWYKAAYPTDTEKLMGDYYKFYMFEADIYEGRKRIRAWTESACGNEIRFNDSVAFNRLWLELYYKKDYVISE